MGGEGSLNSFSKLSPRYHLFDITLGGAQTGVGSNVFVYVYVCASQRPITRLPGHWLKNAAPEHCSRRVPCERGVSCQARLGDPWRIILRRPLKRENSGDEISAKRHGLLNLEPTVQLQRHHRLMAWPRAREAHIRVGNINKGKS